MRQLATLDDEGKARLLADALYAEGIESRVDGASGGRFVVWVLDEPHMDRARELLALLEKSPFDPIFQRARGAAAERRRSEEQAAATARKPVSMRQRWSAQSGGAIPPITFGIIVICGALALLMQFTGYEAIYRWLSYAAYDSVIPTLARTTPFAGIREGQVWRIITPAFMHAQLWGGGGGFGMFHVIFNMWWMKDLGGMLERVQGGRFMIVFVLVVAAISNTAQYVWDGVLYGWGVGPGFVGMSGVVLGVYCYMWARSKLEPATPFFLAPSWGFWLIGFYVICLVGLVGGVANVVHSGGLVAGLAWGALDGLRLRRGR